MSMAILVSVSPGEHRTALLLDGLLTEYWVERPARPDGVGALQCGRVSALAPAMSGAFVALAGNETGFLPESAAASPRKPIAKAVSEGQVLGLRVTRAAQGGKGKRVSALLTPEETAAFEAAPPGAPRLIRPGPTAVQRLAAAHPQAEIVLDSAALAATLRGALGARLRLSPAPLFDDALESELDLLAGHEVPLDEGGRILIHPTPALTAIDVDAGTVAGARSPRAVETLNAFAAVEAARQIRLRNLAGPILLDFAGLSPRRRAALLPALEGALRLDPLSRLIGVTGLGLIEIVRDRVHAPLHDVLGLPPSPLTRGLAALRRAAREAAAQPAQRLALRAAASVLAALRDLPGALEEFTAAAGHALTLIEDPLLRLGEERVEPLA